MKDGWHVIAGYRVYIEEGKDVRGTANGEPVYPYRRLEYQGEKSWTLDTSMSPSAFRACINRGTAMMS